MLRVSVASTGAGAGAAGNAESNAAAAAAAALAVVAILQRLGTATVQRSCQHATYRNASSDRSFVGISI
jgi:hypothetical protein